MKMKDVAKDIPMASQVYGWITSFVGMLTLSEWAILIGILVTVFGYIRESRYKKRLLELEEIKAGVRNKQGQLTK